MDKTYYRAGNTKVWRGRVDGDAKADFRWHQAIQCIDISTDVMISDSVCLIGFACDEGVKRNEGRVGAAKGPEELRSVLAGIPVHHDKPLIDCGDIVCENGDLDRSQRMLANAVAHVLEKKSFPVVLGGGHEVIYGHFLGLKSALSGTIGIINIDAHFDLREIRDGIATSGTGFYQIQENLNKEQQQIHYLALGIQEISNTKRLFDRAEEWGVDYVLAEDIHTDNKRFIIDKINSFAKKIDHIYLTIDLDAFAAPYAPGVSALSFNGLVPDQNFYRIFQHLINLPNLVSVDFAEFNPMYDIDHRTAKLAANLIYQLVTSRK